MSENLKQVEFAKETLRVFEEEGECLTDVRHVMHFFYGGNLPALKSALSEMDYVVTPIDDDGGIMAERHEAIGESWRTSTLLHLCELADSYGVEYDGWEASMERQPAPPSSASEPPEDVGSTSKTLDKKN